MKNGVIYSFAKNKGLELDAIDKEYHNGNCGYVSMYQALTEKGKFQASEFSNIKSPDDFKKWYKTQLTLSQSDDMKALENVSGRFNKEKNGIEENYLNFLEAPASTKTNNDNHWLSKEDVRIISKKMNVCTKFIEITPQNTDDEETLDGLLKNKEDSKYEIIFDEDDKSSWIPFAVNIDTINDAEANTIHIVLFNNEYEPLKES